MSRQDKLLLFYVALFCAGLMIISFFWNSDKFYTNAYAPVIEKSRQDRKIIEENKRQQGRTANKDSEEPIPAGFREKDIEKSRGDGFSTF